MKRLYMKPCMKCILVEMHLDSPRKPQALLSHQERVRNTLLWACSDNDDAEVNKCRARLCTAHCTAQKIYSKKYRVQSKAQTWNLSRMDGYYLS